MALDCITLYNSFTTCTCKFILNYRGHDTVEYKKSVTVIFFWHRQKHPRYPQLFMHELGR